MLEQKDLQAIAELIRGSERIVVDELARIEERLINRVERIEKNLEELNQYYRITKLENDNTALLLKMINDLQKEVDALKSKIA